MRRLKKEKKKKEKKRTLKSFVVLNVYKNNFTSFLRFSIYLLLYLTYFSLFIVIFKNSHSLFYTQTIFFIIIRYSLL